MTFVFTFFIIIRRRSIIECALVIYSYPMSVRLSAFRLRGKSRNFLYFARTHPLEGVDMPFGVYEI